MLNGSWGFLIKAMFNKIKKLCRRGAKVDGKKLLKKVLSVPIIKDQIVDLNQHQLYELGVQSDGTVTGDYAPITITYYKPLAESDGRDGRSDHITGKDTGETYDSMRVKASDTGIVITAEDRNDFFKRIDKGLGLTEESKGEIMPEVKERLNEEIKTKVFRTVR